VSRWVLGAQAVVLGCGSLRWAAAQRHAGSTQGRPEAAWRTSAVRATSYIGSKPSISAISRVASSREAAPSEKQLSLQDAACVIDGTPGTPGQWTAPALNDERRSRAGSATGRRPRRMCYVYDDPHSLPQRDRGHARGRRAAGARGALWYSTVNQLRLPRFHYWNHD
jgi:hypothetical protein